MTVTGCQVPPFSSFFLLFQQCPPFSSFLGKMSSLSSFFMIFRALPIKMYFFWGIVFWCGCFQMAWYMGQSLFQERGAGYTCVPCWAGYLLLDYRKGVRPQPYSCPQVASSEACLTALGPCSLCLGGGG